MSKCCKICGAERGMLSIEGFCINCCEFLRHALRAQYRGKLLSLGEVKEIVAKRKRRKEVRTLEAGV